MLPMYICCAWAWDSLTDAKAILPSDICIQTPTSYPSCPHYIRPKDFCHPNQMPQFIIPANHLPPITRVTQPRHLPSKMFAIQGICHLRHLPLKKLATGGICNPRLAIQDIGHLRHLPPKTLLIVFWWCLIQSYSVLVIYVYYSWVACNSCSKSPGFSPETCSYDLWNKTVGLCAEG